MAGPTFSQSLMTREGYGMGSHSDAGRPSPAVAVAVGRWQINPLGLDRLQTSEGLLRRSAF